MDYEKALQIAKRAHEGQLDKGGKEYVLHPIRVASKLSLEKEKIVAVLHDVIEDTTVTAEDLYQEGFSPEIVDAIVALSRKEGESYKEFILRVKKNDLAKKVKAADIEDNMDLSRIALPGEKDFRRNEKYKKAYKLLSE